MEHKIYIGDGVYLEFSGYDFMMTTSNGRDVTNEIFFDLDMFKKINEFVEAKTKVDKE